MSIWASTNMRDEDNVLEWIAYHLVLGFDNVLILDHASRVPIRRKLQPYNFNGRVTVLRLEANHETGNYGSNFKKYLLNEIIPQFMKEHNAEWFIHLDADEYINLNNNYKNVKAFLNSHPEAHQIALNWVCFGTSGHDTQPKGFLIENFTRCSERCPKMEVKCFVRAKQIIGCKQIHYWLINEPSRSIDANGNKWEPNPFNKASKGLEDKAYINHYVYQSYERYLKRKIKRITDIGTQRPQIAREKLHNIYNSTENQTLVQYGARVRKFLGNRRRNNIPPNKNKK